jgi:cell division protein FtsQ
MLGVATGDTVQPAPRLRRRLRRLLVILWFTSKCLAVLGLGAGLIWGGMVGYRLVRDAPYFRLRTVDIVGNHLLSRSDVQYLLALPAQVTIWQLDLARMGARLERHPYVKSVAIRRLMPDTVTVTVVERVPYAVAVAGQQHMVLDSDGVVLGPALPERDARLPRLKLRDRRALTPGMRLRQRDIRQALELIQAYYSSAATAGTRLVALTIEASGTVVAEVEPYAFAIRLREQALATQLERLPAVAQVIQERELAVQLVDLSYRTRVIVALSES